MKQIKRREFVTSAATAASSFIVGCRTTGANKLAFSEADRPRIRRSVWRQLESDPQLKDYAMAVKTLKALPESDRRHWKNLAATHRDSCPHGNSFFFPWHRAYLIYFEKICAEASGNPNFALPYWDWSESTRLPAPFFDQQSALYNASRAIKDAQQSMFDIAKTFDQGAQDLWSADAIKAIQANTTFQNYVGRASIRPATRPKDIMIAQRQAGGFDPGTGPVAGALEAGPHNYTHAYIGGDMGRFMSPYDPIFWLHHANVDRLWAEWALANPQTSLPLNSDERHYWLHFQLRGEYHGTDPANLLQATGKPLEAFSQSVITVLETKPLGYVYDTTEALEAVDGTPVTSRSTPANNTNKRVLSASSTGITPIVEGNVLSFAIPVREGASSDLRKILARLNELPATADYLLSLQVAHIPHPNQDHALLEFYIEHPNLKSPAIKQSQSPYFVGRVGSFIHGSHDHPMSTSFDLRPVLNRIKQTGWILGSVVKLQLVVRGKLSKAAEHYQSTTISVELIEYT